MKYFTTVFLFLYLGQVKSQSIYFPPLTGNNWDTMSPARLGWCQSSIDSLYSYLEQTHTDAFIVLKDGKIVLEKYFGSFTADSVHYWASAGKSLTAMLTGIAKDKGFIAINNPVSTYLGSGWSAAPAAKENAITLRHLLTMSSGLDDKPPLPCDNEDPSTACLLYLADTGQRWAYHTGAYKKLQNVIAAASGTTYNAFTNTQLGNHIGLTGLWFDGVYYSKPRSMARFGLLALNRGIWSNDTVIKDAAYFDAMVNSSQPYNNAYGYLWWLNGKPSYMAPGLQLVLNGSLIPKAPADMYCALGKNDQKIYVVPSSNMVVVRVGESAYGVAAAFSPFDDLLWGKIDSLGYNCKYVFTGNGNWSEMQHWRNSEIPPAVLDNNSSITITPSPGGECILNVQQTIRSNGHLILPANTRFRILNNLLIRGL